MQRAGFTFSSPIGRPPCSREVAPSIVSGCSLHRPKSSNSLSALKYVPKPEAPVSYVYTFLKASPGMRIRQAYRNSRSDLSSIQMVNHNLPMILRHCVLQSPCCFVLSFLLSLLTKSACFDRLFTHTVANCILFAHGDPIFRRNRASDHPTY